MIDATAGNLIAILDAAKMLPGGENGHLSTEAMRRYYTTGIKGVKLETIRIGGRVYTTREALNAFIAALNPEPPPAPQVRPTPARIRRIHENACNKLRAMGIKV